MKELEQVPERGLSLVVSFSKAYATVPIDTLLVLSKWGDAGVYVTVNKPFEVLKPVFEKKGIPTERVFFIDLITQTSGAKVAEHKNCLFLASPRNLTDFSIALNEVINSLPAGKKFMILDSFNTFTLYNDAQTMLRFTHFISGRLRAWNVRGVIFAVKEETDGKLVAQLSQFVDKIVYF
ncbi:TPA: hypothetical protein HA318_00540 [Candidatus Micrarchaeota archaeon]|nr:hypothetical protein [Candidatus Micrarchaeota archaeon]